MSRHPEPGSVVEHYHRENGEEGWMFFCPGCKCYHSYITKRPEDGSGPIWYMTGTPQSPTFRASLLYPVGTRCHLFVTNGEIQFCTDCDHELAGKYVKMTPA